MPANEDLKYIKDKVDLLCELLTGNGDPEKGIVVRLDRAERTIEAEKQARQNRSTIAWTAMAGAVGAIGLSIWNRLTGL